MCMTLFGGFNEVIRELLVWMIASALYGVLSCVVFNKKSEMPLIAAIGIHLVGILVITMGAALINGYVAVIADVVPVLIPAVVIYVVVYGICLLIMKQNEKQINQALEEK